MKVYETECKNNPISALKAFNGMSDSYKFQSSKDLINVVTSQGFNHINTSFGIPRKDEKRGYQKHVMIFEHDNFYINDENRLQLLVTNSHNGDSSVQFNLGVFRTVCANGLVVGDSFNEFRVAHRGLTFEDKIKTSLNEIILMSDKFSNVVKDWSNVTLTESQVNNMALECLLSRIQDRLDKKQGTLLQFTKIDRQRRHKDNSNDLWTAFNRIQENVLKGFIRFKYSYNIETSDRTFTSVEKLRATNGVMQRIALNKKLWNIAEKFAA